MLLFEIIRNRRSIRGFEKKPVSDEQIIELIDLARHAPSAGNIQPWEFIITKRPEIKKQLSIAALNQAFVKEAPVVIVVCINEERSGKRYGNRGVNLYSIQDTAAAIENMLLAAYAMGLGTCWVGAFREEMVRKTLITPSHVRPVALIAIGYPSKSPIKRGRRSLKEIIHRETF